MQRSQSWKLISESLLKAQKEIGAAKKDADNPFFKKKYADLGAVMEACKEALNKNGITVLQPVNTTDEGVTFVETILLHDSGEFLSSSLKVSCKNPDNPQEMGSAITYARRYSLQSLMFIPAEDDDGEKVAKTFRTQTPEKPQTDNQQKSKYYCLTCKNQLTKDKATQSYIKFKKFLCEECVSKLSIKN